MRGDSVVHFNGFEREGKGRKKDIPLFSHLSLVRKF